MSPSSRSCRASRGVAVFGLLALYNLAYIAPLVAVSILAAKGSKNSGFEESRTINSRILSSFLIVFLLTIHFISVTIHLARLFWLSSASSTS